MYNHRLYIILLLFSLFLSSLIASECDDNFREDKIPFSTRVEQSPIVLIGASLNKNIDPRIRNLFNVTFLVECILKGQRTQRIISIVQAGSLLGRRSCQQLNINRQYIVFLEPFFDETYRPVDFKEIPYSPQIDIVLAKTCGLSRIYPLTEANDTEAIVISKCPATISTDCPTVIETSATKTTVAKTVVPSIVTSSTKFVTKSPPNSFLFGKDPIDIAALSLLLGEHQQQQNLSLAFFQDPDHKSLFSDDDARKNNANQYSFIFSVICMSFSFLFITI